MLGRSARSLIEACENGRNAPSASAPRRSASAHDRLQRENESTRPIGGRNTRSGRRWSRGKCGAAIAPGGALTRSRRSAASFGLPTNVTSTRTPCWSRCCTPVNRSSRPYFRRRRQTDALTNCVFSFVRVRNNVSRFVQWSVSRLWLWPITPRTRGYVNAPGICLIASRFQSSIRNDYVTNVFDFLKTVDLSQAVETGSGVLKVGDELVQYRIGASDNPASAMFLTKVGASPTDLAISWNNRTLVRYTVKAAPPDVLKSSVTGIRLGKPGIRPTGHFSDSAISGGSGNAGHCPELVSLSGRGQAVVLPEALTGPSPRRQTMRPHRSTSQNRVGPAPVTIATRSPFIAFVPELSRSLSNQSLRAITTLNTTLPLRSRPTRA